MSHHLFIHLMSVFLLLGMTKAANPVILKEPDDVTTVSGGDVILNCVVENLPPDDDVVQWTKSGFALGYDRDLTGIPRYSMVGDESIGEYNLQILNATLDDEGEYECQVTAHMMRTRTASVTILVPPQGPKVDDARPDDVIDVMANSDNFLTCRSWDGKPAAQLSWFKDGVKLTENVTYAEIDVTQKLRNSSATLLVWPSEYDDNVVYDCEMSLDPAFQNSGASSDPSKVSVKLNVQKPPVASISLLKQSIREGSTLYAQCDSSNSKPPATYYNWFLGGEQMEGKTASSISFHNINRTMNGAVLACQAVNNVGVSRQSNVALNVLFAPMLITAPTNVTTNMSATVNLTCNWESNPPAVITWYRKNGKDEVEWVGDGGHLTVDVIDQSSSGLYSCVADALGVGSKSVSARIDVLGPPIFDSQNIQQVNLGGKAKVACALESKPGISSVVWSWEQNGNYIALRNNETKKGEGNGAHVMKYSGEIVEGRSTAYLVIYDVTKDDLKEYNCTIHNAYGFGSATIRIEETASPEPVVMVGAIVGAIVGALVLVILLVIVCVCCVMRRRQQKSTTFAPERESLNKEQPLENQDAQLENGRATYSPASKKLVSHDADSDNPSSSASMTSQDGARESLALDEYQQGSSGHNDDGYHTEEANSWNRLEKQSPDSSPARSTRADYMAANLMSPPRNVYERVSPYANSEMGSDALPQSYLKYNIQPNYDAYGPYGPNGVVDLPPRTTSMTPVPMYVGNPYPNTYYQGPPSSTGYRGPAYPPSYTAGPQRSRTGSTTPSIVSSHRSMTPAPYQPVMGRSTPLSVLGDRGLQPYPITTQPDQMGPPSSQSSLEASSLAAADPYENAAKMSQISSRVSQASRSSEFLGNRQLTARMATNV